MEAQFQDLDLALALAQDLAQDLALVQDLDLVLALVQDLDQIAVAISMAIVMKLLMLTTTNVQDRI